MKIDAFICASGRRFLFRHVHLLQKKINQESNLMGTITQLVSCVWLNNFLLFEIWTKKVACKGSFYTSAFRHVCEGEQRIDLQAVNGIFFVGFHSFHYSNTVETLPHIVFEKTLMEVQLFRFVPNRVGRGLLSLNQNHFHGRQGIASGWEQLAHVQSTK